MSTTRHSPSAQHMTTRPSTAAQGWPGELPLCQSVPVDPPPQGRAPASPPSSAASVNGQSPSQGPLHSRHSWLGLHSHSAAPAGSAERGTGCSSTTTTRGRTGAAQELVVPTRCLNSAERLPLFDSSMFMTLVLVPRMLNFRDLGRRESVADRAILE